MDWSKMTSESVIVRPCNLILLFCLSGFFPNRAIELRLDGYHVRPGENIQAALELAAKNRTNKVVRVHAGEYRPAAKRQALIWFNRAHDGIRLEAVGPVTLTAANPELTSRSVASFPAVVNHVVYFGHGISSNTVIRGFRITGANNYVNDKFTRQMEPDNTVPKNLFFFTDGGAIKVFGRSAPIIDQVEIVDNYSSPCGAGLSVQQQGFTNNPVRIQNSVLRRNRAQVTGAAIDLLEGSAAEILNCLFVENASNTGEDVVARRSGEKPFVNSGVLTIFPHSRALVKNCTFTGNRNAVDDMGGGSVYLNSIFYQNQRTGGLVQVERFELNLQNGGVVEGCYISGKILDPSGIMASAKNVLEAPDPRFDSEFTPQSERYARVGFRAERSR
jgi:hypothetical protein